MQLLVGGFSNFLKGALSAFVKLKSILLLLVRRDMLECVGSGVVYIAWTELS